MPFTTPFATGCTAGAARGTGAGDIVANFSCLTAADGGLCALPDELETTASPWEGGLAVPLVVGGVGLECFCSPFMLACNICCWRARASLSTPTPGVGDSRCWLRLSVRPDLAFGPASLSLAAAGSSTFALACVSRLLNASCDEVSSRR